MNRERESNMNKLMHHGVKGQKWGVRNGPPYPIEDKVMKKGTRLNSVSIYTDSSKYKNNGRWMYTYNPNDKWDSKVYKGPFSVYRMQTSKKYVFEHQYEVVKDLKMPTKKERIDEFVNIYKDKSIPTAKELSYLQKQLKDFNIGSEGSKKVNCWKLKTEEDYKNAYEIFNHAMESITSYHMTRKYARIMEQKFDAMVDDNNQQIYNEVHDPVIIFKANEVLKEVGQACMVEMNKIIKNYNSIEKVLNGKGKKILL